MPLSTAPPLELKSALTAPLLAQARELMIELMRWDSAQVSALGLDAALAESFYYGKDDLVLPGDFSPPDGLLLVAMSGNEAAGCGGITAMSPGICELKRLYVREAFRGNQLGIRIVRALLDAAAGMNYRVMRLETVTFMRTAIALYRGLGFQPCDPYYEIPDSFRPITVFMDRQL